MAAAKPLGVLVLACLFLSACAGNRAAPNNDSLGRVAGLGTYKVGKPYQVAGVWYYPSEDPSYDQKGIASWYGPTFHEKYTANGEIFDQNGLSAAHKTLPLPSIVQVTNLENGRSIKVRVNDRGPFVGDRIIDMSRRAAQLLGFENNGTAKVEVRYIVADSIQAQQIARNNGAPEPIPDEVPTAAPSGVVVAQSLSGSVAQPVAYRVSPVAARTATGYAGSSLPPPPPMPSYATIPPEHLTQPPAAAPRTAAAAPPPVTAAQEQTLEGELSKEPQLPQAASVGPVHPSSIFIQAGAFRESSRAQDVKSKLVGLGSPVTVTQFMAGGAPFFRVRVGPVSSVDAADRLVEQVHQAGFEDAKIVVN